uniref:Neurotransmitter-gated ion-channel ligand-binding domain-containing protein n=1 Tax=Parascaris equorum TaxID=6256 RepID=A0A914RBF5_PAREQ
MTDKRVLGTAVFVMPFVLYGAIVEREGPRYCADRWVDYQMRWDPREYANIQTIRVPPDKVWLPDIVLFNK